MAVKEFWSGVPKPFYGYAEVQSIRMMPDGGVLNYN
jgi:hypothetical protein